MQVILEKLLLAYERLAQDQAKVSKPTWFVDQLIPRQRIDGPAVPGHRRALNFYRVEP